MSFIINIYFGRENVIHYFRRKTMNTLHTLVNNKFVHLYGLLSPEDFKRF